MCFRVIKLDFGGALYETSYSETCTVNTERSATVTVGQVTLSNRGMKVLDIRSAFVSVRALAWFLSLPSLWCEHRNSRTTMTHGCTAEHLYVTLSQVQNLLDSGVNVNVKTDGPHEAK